MNEQDYTAIDNSLQEVAKRLSSLPYLPYNFEAEKKRFFNSSSYEPVFCYKKPSADLNAIKEKLLALDIPVEGIGLLFKRKQIELLNIITMMQSVGTRKFSEVSKKMYGTPDDALVKTAWKLIAIHDQPDCLYLSSQQVVVHLQHAMKKYGFDWKVKAIDMASKAAVNTVDKTLYIKKDSFMTRKFLKRLIVHEIGTHILRYENGVNQPYKIFATGLTHYLPTEEGLAVMNEELHNCLTKATLKTYAARVIAVHKALKCTFRETYKHLLPYVGKQNAFEITFRVKRGLGNTRWPGAFTKDFLYLKGYLDVKAYLESGKNMTKLYYGKIGLDDIQAVEKIQGLINPLFFKTMKYYTDVVRYRR